MDTFRVGMTTASTEIHILHQSRKQATPLMHSGRVALPAGCTPPRSGQRTYSTQLWSGQIPSSGRPGQSRWSRRRRPRRSRWWPRVVGSRSCWPGPQIWCRPQSPGRLWASQKQWPCSPLWPVLAWLCKGPPLPRRPARPGWSRRSPRSWSFGPRIQRMGTLMWRRRGGRPQMPWRTFRQDKGKNMSDRATYHGPLLPRRWPSVGKGAQPYLHLLKVTHMRVAKAAHVTVRFSQETGRQL